MQEFYIGTDYDPEDQERLRALTMEQVPLLHLCFTLVWLASFDHIQRRRESVCVCVCVYVCVRERVVVVSVRGCMCVCVYVRA